MASEMINHNWFRFFGSDWLNATSRMHNDEAGAYLNLILDYYRSGPLPNDMERIRIIARTPLPDWQRVWGSVGPKFVLQPDGKLHNRKCDEEIAWRDSQYAQRVEAGKLGVEARLANKQPEGQPTAEPIGKPPGKPAGEPDNGWNGELDGKFIKALLQAYRRPADARMTFAEQSTVALLIRERPRYWSEWGIISNLRQQDPKYFPKSLSSLLLNWQETLDRANNFVPEGKPIKTLIEREVERL